jgi:hypothetical protein
MDHTELNLIVYFMGRARAIRPPPWSKKKTSRGLDAVIKSPELFGHLTSAHRAKIPTWSRVLLAGSQSAPVT